MESACPLCGGSPGAAAFPYATRWQDREFRYRRCMDCTAVFVVPRPTEEELRAVYDWDAYHATHYADPSADAARHQRTLDVLGRHLPAGSRILDFGCGAGGFLLAATAAGYECDGVEYAESAIAHAARATGLHVTSLDGAIDSGARYGAVHLSDVIAHLPAPAETLQRVAGLLEPSGVMLVAGPLEDNAGLVHWVAKAGGVVRRLMRTRRAVPEGPPTMLARTSRRSQRRFFVQAGYRELEFHVFETGWPYREAGGLRRAIGTAAVLLARALPGGWVGNRFLGVWRPAGG